MPSEPRYECDAWPGLPEWTNAVTPRRWDRHHGGLTWGHVYLYPGDAPCIEAFAQASTEGYNEAEVVLDAARRFDLTPECLLEALRWSDAAAPEVTALAERLGNEAAGAAGEDADG